MATERIRQRIERLLDQAEQAADRRDWQAVRERTEDILAFDPDNADAKAFLAAANQRLADTPRSGEAADARKGTACCALRASSASCSLR